MHVVSQIFERNFQRSPEAATGLWINPENDTCWRTAQQRCPGLTLLCQYYGNYLFQRQAGADVDYSALPEKPTRSCQWVILNLPRQKELLQMLLDRSADLLANDGVLWLAGENRAGIKSADRLLGSFFGQVRKLDNARHCTLYEARMPIKAQVFNHLDYRQSWPLQRANQQLEIISYPGVFAHGRLDAGTALLLDALEELQPAGKVLDLGCGAGVIGACIKASQNDARVSFLDHSALALKACRETLLANQLEGNVLASDGLSELQQTFDLIVSNPPLHTGVRTDKHLSQRLLGPTSQQIKPGGRLILVANRHLPYEKWLAKRFKSITELAVNSKFKIIVAKN